MNKIHVFLVVHNGACYSNFMIWGTTWPWNPPYHSLLPSLRPPQEQRRKLAQQLVDSSACEENWQDGRWCAEGLATTMHCNNRHSIYICMYVYI